MNICFSKTGSSSKPNRLTTMLVSARNFVDSWKILHLLGYLTLISSVLISYYLYLDNLYILDEVLDVGGPRELLLRERTTIRVLSPPNYSNLNHFVLTYSVCPVVKEIQIVWSHPEPYPLSTSFKYEHTHSKVTFNSNPSSFETATDSVILLDADVMVSCSDLLFTQTVWRSSKDALVGFFPRSHNDNSDQATEERPDTLRTNEVKALPKSLVNKFRFIELREVLWTSSYSLLLSSGVMLKKEYLQDFEKSAVISSLLTTHPQCYDLAVPVFAAHLQAPGPILVDVPFTILSGVKLTAHYSGLVSGSSGDKNDALLKPNASVGSVKHASLVKLTTEQRSECLSLLMKELKLAHLATSQFKAAVAKHQWIW